MQLVLKILKFLTIPKNIWVALPLFICFGLVSCTENSDKIVNDSLDVKHFEVDQFSDGNFNLETSSLVESVVVAEGIIQDINYLNNRSTIILKGKKDSRKLVICDMQNNQKAMLKNLNLGDDLAVKGILKGTLNDIILLNCIIPQSRTNE